MEQIKIWIKFRENNPEKECTTPDEEAGVCLACSLVCHKDCQLVEALVYFNCISILIVWAVVCLSSNKQYFY